MQIFFNVMQEDQFMFKKQLHVCTILHHFVSADGCSFDHYLVKHLKFAKTAFWSGYLPTQLYSLDSSAYGTSAQLKELIDEFHRQDICCIADIVINHRSGVKQDSKGHWNIFKGGNPDKRLDWGPWAVVDDDVYDSGGKGKHDTGESYGAAPDLDHTNKQVQDELTDWMNWMRAEIGFDGWRFDFVKGYHPKYTNL